MRSVNFIINVLSDKATGSTSNGSPHTSSSSGHDSTPSIPVSISDALRRYLFKLAPLKSVEDSLTKNLIGNIDDPVRGYNPQKASEFTVRSNGGWRGFMKLRRASVSSTTPSAVEKAEEIRNRRLLNACADDIIALWEDTEVQKELKALHVNLQDQSGLYVSGASLNAVTDLSFSFLSDTARISAFDYTPTPEDIVRARMHTIGPEEHRIPVETAGPESGKTW